MATISSKTVQSLAVAQAASQDEGAPSLLQTFQAHVEDMRNLVLCKICIRPLYEPYTLGCGHTYCYSCLTSWFAGAPARRRKMNCPDCRASVMVQPSPNYLLRDLVHMFISRVELLPEDETTAQHDEAMRVEAQLIETDRTTRANGEPGLFKGVFNRPELRFGGVIRDEEDGVLRCPVCAWEMEDGECGHCGYSTHDGDWSDEEDHEDGTIDSQSVISIQSSPMDGDIDAEHLGYHNPFIDSQNPELQENFRQWQRRDQANRREGRVIRDIQRVIRHDTVSAADSIEYLLDRDNEPVGEDGDSEDEEIAAFLDRHPIDDHRWDTSTAETEDEDEEMTSVMDEDDAESTTSFHRAAMLARDQGMNPPFSSDLSTNASDGDGDGETVTNEDESEESENDDNTPERTPTVQRLANRPARIIIDSEDESDDDESSSDEEEDDEIEHDAERGEDPLSDDDTTPSPPRPAATRQARVQIHRGRRGSRGRSRGRGRARGRG